MEVWKLKMPDVLMLLAVLRAADGLVAGPRARGGIRCFELPTLPHLLTPVHTVASMQVISGLVEFVPVDRMQGLRVLVVCNLKPQKMREIMSYGMVRGGRGRGFAVGVQPEAPEDEGVMLYGMVSVHI